MHRTSPTKGHFSKIRKHNQPIRYIEIKSKLGKMRQQRNISQMKEQDKTPEEELSEVAIGNLPKKEFEVMIVKMIKELRRKMDEHQEVRSF